MTLRLPALSRRIARSKRRGFSLLEMLVAVSILVVIIYALYQMFNQTQRAFRGGVTQVDVMEAGRAAMAIIAQELQQSAATGVGDATNFYKRLNPQGFVTSLGQSLPDGTLVTNEMEEFYFLTHPNGRTWQGHGFFLDTNMLPAPTAVWGPGTLYRLKVDGVVPATDMLGRVVNNAGAANTGTCFPVCEGVIHFKIRPLSADGLEITNSIVGDNLPHYVDIELGILDPPMLALVRTIPTQAAYTNFLLNRSGNIHVFKQTIPIRTASR